METSLTIDEQWLNCVSAIGPYNSIIIGLARRRIDNVEIYYLNLSLILAF